MALNPLYRIIHNFKKVDIFLVALVLEVKIDHLTIV